MNARLSLCRRRSCYAAVVGALALLGVALIGQAGGGEKPYRGKKTPAQMVEDLANRNKPPKLVVVGPDRLPLFPKDYDWEEQHRVQEALTEMSKDTSEELWEELVRRSDDPRYCLTDMDNGDWAWNRSVGDFCSGCAGPVLTDVALRHLPRQGKRIPDLPRQGKMVPGMHPGVVPVIVAADIIKDITKPGLREWCEKRKGKALYQLQLELCEQALAKVRDAEGIPEGEREAARKAMEAEATKLRQTKRPAEVRPGRRVWDICTREYAEQCRKKIEGKE